MPDLPHLTTDDWKSLHEALTLYARYKVLRLSWRGMRRGKSDLTNQGGPEDIAADAIVRVIEGRRQCNASNYKELLLVLKGVVDSIVSHSVSLLENQMTRNVKDIASEQGSPAHVSGRSNDPGTAIAEKESISDLRNQILKKLHIDALVPAVLECLEGGMTRPSEIAELLDVPVKEIYNAQKRLRNAVDSVLRQQGRQRYA